MDTELTTLERLALEAALAGGMPWKEHLRQQLPHLRAVARRYTGVGFYTDFMCENCRAATGLPPPDSPENVPVAWAAHPNIFDGAKGTISFNVFLKDGVIVCLEAASTAEWPENEDQIVFCE